jgi:hypothetical protein
MTTFRAALTLLVCATAIAAGAQEPSYAVLFRVTDSKLRPEPSSTTNCVIVENGSYRLEVKNGTGKAEKRNTSIFLGKLPDQVSERLRVLIAAPELVALGDVKMSKEPQAFTDALQIVGQQVSYMNGDGTQSIPAPVKAFIPWLKSLLKDNRPIKDTDPNSCQSLDPAGNTKP